MIINTFLTTYFHGNNKWEKIEILTCLHEKAVLTHFKYEARNLFIGSQFLVLAEEIKKVLLKVILSTQSECCMTDKNQQIKADNICYSQIVLNVFFFLEKTFIVQKWWEKEMF